MSFELRTSIDATKSVKKVNPDEKLKSADIPKSSYNYKERRFTFPADEKEALLKKRGPEAVAERQKQIDEANALIKEKAEKNKFKKADL